MENTIIVGADIEIIELIERVSNLNIVGIIDNKLNGDYYGYEILGTDSDAKLLIKKLKISSAIITIDSPLIKERIYKQYKNYGLSFPSVISKNAEVSKHAIINEGVIIQNGVNVGPNCELGLFAKLNVNANIMHDVQLGNFCTVAPNAVCLGYAKIASSTFVGANATILPKITVNENSIIGAGSIVTKDVESNVIMIGNPARILRTKD